MCTCGFDPVDEVAVRAMTKGHLTGERGPKRRRLNYRGWEGTMDDL